MQALSDGQPVAAATPRLYLTPSLEKVGSVWLYRLDLYAQGDRTGIQALLAGCPEADAVRAIASLCGPGLMPDHMARLVVPVAHPLLAAGVVVGALSHNVPADVLLVAEGSDVTWSATLEAVGRYARDDWRDYVDADWVTDDTDTDNTSGRAQWRQRVRQRLTGRLDRLTVRRMRPYDVLLVTGLDGPLGAGALPGDGAVDADATHQGQQAHEDGQEPVIGGGHEHRGRAQDQGE